MPRLLHWVSRRIVDAASFLLPDAARDGFREEWHADLWHLARAEPGRGAILVRRAGGAIRDAGTVRRLRRRHCKRSPSMLGQDVRLALRSFRRRPLWAAVIVLTLAVGTGANTAIFSLVNGVLLQPLDFPEPERLVKVIGANVKEGARQNLSPADFYDLASRSQTIESMGAHGWVGFSTIAGDGEPERIGATGVTAGFFPTLGVRPGLGRLFTEEDDRPGAPDTVVFTYGFWRRRFAGRPDVLGRTVVIDARPHEIVGVLPADYSHPEPSPERDPALYTLYQFDRTDLCRSCRFIRAIGRLREYHRLAPGSGCGWNRLRGWRRWVRVRGRSRRNHRLALRDGGRGRAR